jgi:hypothetical protein
VSRHVHSAAQLVGCPADVAHQHLAFIGEVNMAGVAFEERDAENLL